MPETATGPGYIVILIIIVALVVVTVAGTLVFGRYFLTTSVQQRLVEQRNTPALTTTP